VIRRHLLQMIMGLPMAGDGLARPMNAPPASTPAPGVQPGVSSGVDVANVVIVYGPNAGLFEYAGTPGPGNPPVIWATEAARDPYKNALPFTGLGVRNGSGLTRIDGGTIQVGAAGEFTMGTLNDSGTGVTSLESSTASNVDVAAALELFSKVASPTGNPAVWFIPGSGANGGVFLDLTNGTVYPAQPGTNSTPEAWHVIGQPGEPAFGAGFGAPGIADQTARYRYTTDGYVKLDGIAVTTAATAANAVLWTFANTGYYPLKRKRFSGDTNASGYVTPGQSLIQVNVGPPATVNVVPAASGAGQVIVLDGMEYPIT
jgi:hypothetical protein